MSPKEHRYDSDAGALAVRADLNASRAKVDLEDWIFSNVQPCRYGKVLDIGCGLGKQLFYFAERLGEDTKLLGVDISEDAVATVNSRAKQSGRSNVRAVAMGIDECVSRLEGENFDLILSTYAIYYSADMVGVLCQLRDRLNAEGTMMISGFGRDSNREVVDIVNGALADDSRRLPYIDDFMNDMQFETISAVFTDSRRERLENKVVFARSSEVMSWWRNHNSYREEVGDEVDRRIADIIDKEGKFKLSKNVFGVRFDV